MGGVGGMRTPVAGGDIEVCAQAVVYYLVLVTACRHDVIELWTAG